ncbi:MAG: DUF2851 family protein [Rhodothermaceae bacterium]|nr:DUF2851 family protein [Rhodothermaceae bacterium]
MKTKPLYSASPLKGGTLFYGSQDDVYEVKVHEPNFSKHKIPESLLHDIWQYQRIKKEYLKTTNYQSIEIIRQGIPNLDSGPDFLNATIIIDGIKWHGAIEIHGSSKEWYHHKHHEDQRYNNTILHLSLLKDLYTGTLRRQDGSLIPELILLPLLKTSLRSLIYNKAVNPSSPLPCTGQLKSVPESIKNDWCLSVSKARLSRKKRQISEVYLNTPDYDSILHSSLFKALGYDKNSEAMGELAKRIPLSVSRQLHAAVELEALHFGVAGLLPHKNECAMLPPEESRNARKLIDIFEQLQKTFNIPTMHSGSWLFFRLRPANFPTLRIAQATTWLSKGSLLYHDPLGQLFEAVNQPKPFSALLDLLQCRPSTFWHTHYHFRKKAHLNKRILGKQRLIKLIINALIPLLLFIADQNDDIDLENRIMEMLRSIPPEDDYVTRLFAKENFQLSDGIMSQGIHELYSSFCKPLQCLSCDIGKHLIQTDNSNNE